MQRLLAAVPAFAPDLKENLVLALGAPDLTQTQIWGSALAAALACREQRSIAHIGQIADKMLDASTRDAAKGAAVMMSANNIYWRFWYLVEDKEYLAIKPDYAEAIMNNFGGIPEVDFECFCLAASAINNCAGCLKVHSRRLLKLGFTKTQVMHVVRIAAVMRSLAVALAGSILEPALE